MGIAAKIWLNTANFGCSSLSAAVPAVEMMLAFNCYFILLYLYWTAFPGRTGNEFPAFANTQRWRKASGKHLSYWSIHFFVTLLKFTL